MQHNNKGFVWLPVLLGILAVLVVSGGAWWYVHEQTPQYQIPIYLPAATNTPSASSAQQPSAQSTSQTTQLNFVATPLSGNTPLNVVFTVPKPSDWPTTASGTSYQMKLDYGDGTSDFVIPGSCHACGGLHTYNKSGTYTAELTDYTNYPKDGKIIGTATIIVIATNPPAAISWSMYTSAQYGFQLEYPTGTKLPDHMYGPNDNAIRFQPIGGQQNAPDSFVINVMSGGSCSNQAVMASTPPTQVVINGASFIKYDLTQEYTSTRFTYYCTFSNGMEYLIGTVPPANEEVSSDPILSRVISSFKFTQ